MLRLALSLTLVFLFASCVRTGVLNIGHGVSQSGQQNRVGINPNPSGGDSSPVGPQIGTGNAYDASGPLRLIANSPYYFFNPGYQCTGAPPNSPTGKIVFTVQDSVPIGTVTDLCSHASGTINLFEVGYSAYNPDYLVWQNLLFVRYAGVGDLSSLTAFTPLYCRSDLGPDNGFDLVLTQKITTSEASGQFTFGLGSIDPSLPSQPFLTSLNLSAAYDGYPFTVSATNLSVGVTVPWYYNGPNGTITTSSFSAGLYCTPNIPPPKNMLSPSYGSGMPQLSQFQFDPSQCVDYSQREFMTPNILEVIDGQSAPCMTSNVKVAVMDTGIDNTHPDLNVVETISYVDSEPVVPGKTDPNGHGTHVAGIIGAKACNGQGIRGLAPGAPLVSMKVLANSGIGSEANVMRALVDLGRRGDIRVANLSFYETNSPTLDAKIDSLWQQGIMVVTAAGNFGINANGLSPTNASSAFAIGSTSGNYPPPIAFDTFSSFSDWGSSIFLVAPGENILSTYPGARYCRLSGTSMSAAEVTGAIAYYLGNHPSATNTEVRNALIEASRIQVSGTHQEPFKYRLLRLPQ